jgi:hypothetical protein
MPHAQGSSILTFKANSLNQYYVDMNHSFQKYHEEDAIACVLDVMEEQGWTYKFQYDAESSSRTILGKIKTSHELFIFHKPGH